MSGARRETTLKKKLTLHTKLRYDKKNKEYWIWIGEHCLSIFDDRHRSKNKTIYKWVFSINNEEKKHCRTYKEAYEHLLSYAHYILNY